MTLWKKANWVKKSDTTFLEFLLKVHSKKQKQTLSVFASLLLTQNIVRSSCLYGGATHVLLFAKQTQKGQDLESVKEE